MQKTKTVLGLLLLISAFGFSQPTGAQNQAIVFGTIGLQAEDGGWFPGHMIRVNLVAAEIPVRPPALTGPAQTRMARLNSTHLDFFKAFRERERQPGFLVATAISGSGGTFTFKNLPPRRYVIVVTFPSMIDGRKVAWQVPVDLRDQKHLWIRLDSGNLLLPAVARY